MLYTQLTLFAKRRRWLSGLLWASILCSTAFPAKAGEDLTYVLHRLSLTVAEADWLADRPTLLADTYAFLREREEDDIAAPVAAQALRFLRQYGGLSTAVTVQACCIEEFGEGYGWWEHIPDWLPGAEALQEEALFLRIEYPYWSGFRIFLTAHWRVAKQYLHTALDICGMVEVMGSPCDLANGIFYAIEGDGWNATLSFLAAMPAGIIITGTRLLRKAVVIGGRTRRFTWREIGGKVVFSHSTSYRKVWGITSPGVAAHHIVPKKLWDNPVIQFAARANPKHLPPNVNPFHMNMPENGLGVALARHTGSHNRYSDKIENELYLWIQRNPTATPEQAAKSLALYQQILWKAISNSARHIDDLVIPSIPFVK